MLSGVIPPGTISNEITSQLDWFPTLASLTNSKIPDESEIIDLCKKLDIKVEVRSISVEEIINYHRNKELFEVFGSGTAVVIKPIRGFGYKGIDYELPVLKSTFGEQIKKKLVDIHPSILFIEMRAKRLFIFWANLIKRKSINTKKRNFWVAMYKYYLIFALFVVSPIVLAVYTLLVRPIIWSSIKKNKEHFLYLGIER